MLQHIRENFGRWFAGHPSHNQYRCIGDPLIVCSTCVSELFLCLFGRYGVCESRRFRSKVAGGSVNLSGDAKRRIDTPRRSVGS